MEAENKAQFTRDGYTKLDSNYYRILQYEFWKVRYWNFVLGLLIGFFCGSSQMLGFQIMLYYNHYYTKAVWFFVKWFPIGFGALLLAGSMLVMFYQIMAPEKEE